MIATTNSWPLVMQNQAGQLPGNRHYVAKAPGPGATDYLTLSRKLDSCTQTASLPAILHFLEGSAAVTLAEQSLAATTNSVNHMAAKLLHSIKVHHPFEMLLLLLNGVKQNV